MPLVKTYNVKILKKINSANTTRRRRRHSTANADVDGTDEAQRTQTEQTSHRRRGRDTGTADANADGAADGTV